MTQAERNRRYIKGLFNPTAVVLCAAGAGILQWENTPGEWKQGGEAYAERYASTFGAHIVRGTLMFGLSSALHEDNHYILCHCSGFGPRLKYAIESTFLARRDDGSRGLSFSRLGATAGTAVVSRAWQPPSNRQPVNAVSSFGISIATQVGLNVVREFLWHRRTR